MKGRRNVASGAVWQPVLGTIKLWEFGFGDSDILYMQLTRDFNYFCLGLHWIQKAPPVTVVLAQAWLPSGSSADPTWGWAQSQRLAGMCCEEGTSFVPKPKWDTGSVQGPSPWREHLLRWILLVLPAKINVAVFLKTEQTENSGAAPLLSYSSDMCC